MISWEAEHTEQQIGQAFYMQKKHTISILHMGYKVIGYMFAKQSYWYKLRGLLFKFKAILLVQTARAFFKLRRPRAFYWVHIDWPAPGHPMGAGNPTISRETETQVLAPCRSWPPASPGPLPAPAPAAPQNKTFFFLSFKNQQEKYQTHEL